MKKLFFLFGFAVFWTGCDNYRFINFEPVFISVDEVELRTPSGSVISQGIKDLWIFQDDLYLGTYPIPGRIPISTPFTGEIKIFPGIRHYGILSRPEIYPLMNEFVQQINLSSFDSIYILPVFFYKNGLITLLNESFETGNNFSFDLDSFPASSLERTQAKSREGLFAAVGHLSQASPTIEVASGSIKVNDITKRVLYLELDFLSSVEVQFGLSFPQNGINVKNYFLTLLPASDWKKVYIPLHEILLDQPITSFQLIIKSSLPGVEKADFYLDNFKILSLP